MRKLLSAGLAALTLAGAGWAASPATAQTVVVQERWGHWDPAWGRDTGPPPHRHWRGHEANWYGHVHGCMMRYETYDYRCDMYREGRRWVPCRD